MRACVMKEPPCAQPERPGRTTWRQRRAGQRPAPTAYCARRKPTGAASATDQAGADQHSCYRLLRGPHARDQPDRRHQQIQSTPAQAPPRTVVLTLRRPLQQDAPFRGEKNLFWSQHRNREQWNAQAPAQTKRADLAVRPPFFTATELRWIRSAGCTSCTGSDRYRSRRSRRSSSSAASTSADPCDRTRCSRRQQWWHPTVPSS